jgi:hypothetical protein
MRLGWHSFASLFKVWGSGLGCDMSNIHVLDAGPANHSGVGFRSHCLEAILDESLPLELAFVG